MNEQPSLEVSNDVEEEKSSLKVAMEAMLEPAQNIKNLIKKFRDNI